MIRQPATSLPVLATVAAIVLQPPPPRHPPSPTRSRPVVRPVTHDSSVQPTRRMPGNLNSEETM